MKCSWILKPKLVNYLSVCLTLSFLRYSAELHLLIFYDFTVFGDCSVTRKIPKIIRLMLKVENSADNYWIINYFWMVSGQIKLLLWNAQFKQIIHFDINVYRTALEKLNLIFHHCFTRLWWWHNSRDNPYVKKGNSSFNLRPNG